MQAMGKNSFYLGEVGNASKMNLVLQTMVGDTCIYLALMPNTAKLWWAGLYGLQWAQSPLLTLRPNY